LEQLEKGRLNFTFYGKKLRGKFVLLQMKDRKGQWLIIKEKRRACRCRLEVGNRLETEICP
jgi:hypothetical protein